MHRRTRARVPAQRSPAACSFNAEIDFDGRKLLERYLARQDVPAMKRHFAAASGAASDYHFEEVMKDYGTGVVSQVGREVRAASAVGAFVAARAPGQASADGPSAAQFIEAKVNSRMRSAVQVAM